ASLPRSSETTRLFAASVHPSAAYQSTPRSTRITRPVWDVPSARVSVTWSDAFDTGAGGGGGGASTTGASVGGGSGEAATGAVLGAHAARISAGSRRRSIDLPGFTSPPRACRPHGPGPPCRSPR